MRRAKKLTPEMRLASWTLALLACGTAAIAWVSWGSGIDCRLRARADQIFEYERTHHGRIPLNRLASLSMALEFHDKEGVERQIAEIEASL